MRCDVRWNPPHHGGATSDHHSHVIFDFIERWYNNEFLHSILGYLSPAEYEQPLLTAA